MAKENKKTYIVGNGVKLHSSDLENIATDLEDIATSGASKSIKDSDDSENKAKKG